MPEDERLEPLAGIFGVLSDKRRLSILMDIAARERNVGTLRMALTMRGPNLSHHLMLLRLHGLICRRRSGQGILYRLSDRVSKRSDVLTIETDHFKVTIKAK
jgi:DNA-binding transcriptional ArsR family regulator